MSLLFDFLARLSLPALHRLGVVFGWMVYGLSGRYAARLRDNLRQAQVADSDTAYRRLLRANVGEAGKGVLELPWVWLRPYEEVLASVKNCEGWEHVEAAHLRGKGVIFLTPHMGCFEMLSLYIAARYPLTSMYRAPRQRFLDGLMQRGRRRGMVKLAPADMSGVRLLLKALRQEECIGILPDQAPGNGEGTWAPFFGRPAYTMTLFGRLQASSGASVMLCHSVRLPDGKGFTLHFEPLQFDGGQPVEPQLNAALERLIRTCPEQYLWSYNRYKVPRGANPPPTEGVE
ncbi:MAG: lysophospholipid acyltransferase family protein [Gammaproteobacteria bacterium]|nr:lysophospholipid acyltransferase family protein [Gammaproteobacteria bacterium]MBU1447870.1 lysophospholipid acyltransferase family protein [Gammaproteobacteria bacterium]MDD5470800.1 lysophospholipid acyltransferase family protein [Sideroxydans sp.]